MKEYRIYRVTDKPEFVCIKDALVPALNTIDAMVMDNQYVLGIVHTTELNMDETLIMYHGNMQQYLARKKYLLQKEAYRQRRELIHSISADYTRKFSFKHE